MQDASNLAVMLVVLGLTIAISMLVALVIRGMTSFLGRSAEHGRSRLTTSAPPPAVKSAPNPESTGPGADGRPPDEHVAVIAAAVSVVFDDAQIVHIEPSRQDVGWSSSGRQAHHSSHHLGPRTPRRPNAPRTHDS